MAPPSSLVMPPTSMDTLSTLREVSSNPPSPESSSSIVFPQLVVSPPLFGDTRDNEESFGKQQNGLSHSPTWEPSILEARRWWVSSCLKCKVNFLSNSVEVAAIFVVLPKFCVTTSPFYMVCFQYFQDWLHLLPPLWTGTQGVSLENIKRQDWATSSATRASVLTPVFQANIEGVSPQLAKPQRPGATEKRPGSISVPAIPRPNPRHFAAPSAWLRLRIPGNGREWGRRKGGSQPQWGGPKHQL